MLLPVMPMLDMLCTICAFAKVCQAHHALVLFMSVKFSTLKYLMAFTDAIKAWANNVQHQYQCQYQA